MGRRSKLELNMKGDMMKFLLTITMITATLAVIAGGSSIESAVTGVNSLTAHPQSHGAIQFGTTMFYTPDPKETPVRSGIKRSSTTTEIAS
jgi:hypothetical protein